MSKNLELAEALMILSRATEGVAKIFLKFDEIKDDTVLTTVGTSDETIDFATYQAWPLAEEVPSYEYRSRISANRVQLLHGQTILEHSAGPVEPISPYFTHIFGECQVDILSDKFVGCKEPLNLRLINKSELKAEYDIGIAWESLMFTSPVEVLTLMKHRCKKIHVRFRPCRAGMGLTYHQLAIKHSSIWYHQPIMKSLIWL